MKVSERIERGAACEVINLSGTEETICRDCGWHLAAFKNGRLEFMQSLIDYPGRDDCDLDLEAQQNFEQLNQWARQHIAEGHEVWMVMQSARQLCQPYRYKPEDSLANARLIRLCGEALMWHE